MGRLIRILTIYSHHLAISHGLVVGGTLFFTTSSNIGVTFLLFSRVWSILYIHYYTCANPGVLDLDWSSFLSTIFSRIWSLPWESSILFSSFFFSSNLRVAFFEKFSLYSFDCFLYILRQSNCDFVAEAIFEKISLFFILFLFYLCSYYVIIMYMIALVRAGRGDLLKRWGWRNKILWGWIILYFW